MLFLKKEVSLQTRVEVLADVELKAKGETARGIITRLSLDISVVGLADDKNIFI